MEIFMIKELKDAVALLKRVYLLAIIPNSDGNDHIAVQDSINKLETHVNSLPSEEAAPPVPPETPPVDQPPAPEAPAAPQAPEQTGYADGTPAPAAPPENPTPTA